MLRIVKKGASIIIVLFAFSVITACGGSGGGGGGPITVSGIVVDDTYAPVDGADVMLNHDAASLVTTGPTGTFSFTGVQTPYTLTTNGGGIVEYRGLTRSNPQLTTHSMRLTTLGGATYGTTLDGIVTGPNFSLPADQAIAMGATNNVYTVGGVNRDTGVFSASLEWSGFPSKSTDLAALHIGVTGNLISNYFQTGTLTGVNLSSGVAQTNLTVALSEPVTTASTILNYNPGAYSAYVRPNYLMVKANGAKFYILSGNIPSGTSVLLPADGGTFMVRGDDVDRNSITRIGTAVLGGTTNLDLPSSTVLKNSLPPDAATDISKTPTLSWMPVSGADAYRVTLSEGGTIMYEVYMPGSSSTLTIPDYTILGRPLSGNMTYTWSVYAFTSSGWSTNFLTDPATGGASEMALNQSSNFTLYQSGSTTFTTVP